MDILPEKKYIKKKLLDKDGQIDEDDKNENKKVNQKNNKLSENENINTANKGEDEIDIKNIFGEPFLKKEKELKNKSLFGKLNTYKIFSCIIKTNEDLRQEQFATQLINEFYQIFKLENTGCWLNTYEIISTGNNSA